VCKLELWGYQALAGSVRVWR